MQASLQLSESFATLRDRNDVVVHADDLEIVSSLGAPLQQPPPCQRAALQERPHSRCHDLGLVGAAPHACAAAGEGAYGTVEQAIWKPPPGAPSASQLARRSQDPMLSQTSQPQLQHQGSQAQRGKRVAVKRLKKEVLNEADDVLEMFMNECSLNRKLKHK